MIFSALRGLSHFWQFGTVHTVLLPLTLLVALAVQLFVINREKWPLLPLAICGGVVCCAMSPLSSPPVYWVGAHCCWPFWARAQRCTCWPSSLASQPHC